MSFLNRQFFLCVKVKKWFSFLCDGQDKRFPPSFGCQSSWVKFLSVCVGWVSFILSISLCKLYFFLLRVLVVILYEFFTFQGKIFPNFLLKFLLLNIHLNNHFLSLGCACFLSRVWVNILFLMKVNV